MIDPKVRYQAQVIEDLKKSCDLHDAQKLIAKAVFFDGKKKIFVECGRKFGKMLRLSTKIVTHNGFTTMGDVKVGDLVINRYGKPTKVTYKSPIHTDDKCYEITMSDGTVLFAGKSHQWIVKNKLDRKSTDRFGWSWRGRGERVVTTEDIAKSISYGKELNWSVDCCDPIEFEGKDLPIDPYLLGLWLGDGHTASAGFTTADEEIVDSIRNLGYDVTKTADKYGYYIKGLQSKLRELGVLGNKHIPDIYKFSSVKNRIALLQGLFDSDGSCDKRGFIEFSSTLEHLVLDARFILCSLGQKMPEIGNRIPICANNGNEGARSWRFTFSPSRFCFFRLKRKRDRLREKKKPDRLFFKEVKEIPVEPMACISVESECESYLISDSCVVTHNTTSIPYCAYRQCMSFPGSVVYIIGPFLKQMKEIIWVDGRITHFLAKDLHDKYVSGINNTELRVMFHNGSMIKCDGADNYEAFRGPNPHMVLYDEFKDHHPKFHEGMDPNLMSHNAPLLVFGTPPESDDNQFVTMADDVKIDPDGAYFNFPSWANPHLDKEWLKKKKAELIRKGQWDVWAREYEAKRVKGGSNAIFPMFAKDKHIVKYETVISEVRRYPKDWEYVYQFDPGSRTVFAGLACICNKRTKKFVVVDEIYEKTAMRQTTGVIYPMARTQMDTIRPYNDDWLEGYDHAAAWFANEVLFQYDRALMPCEKDVKTKNDKESMIRDMMLNGFFFITDKCVNLKSEIENYIKDEKGSTKKCADHALDCVRYALNAINYDFTPDMAIKTVDDEKRFYRMDEERRTDVDPVYDMCDWLYE